MIENLFGREEKQKELVLARFKTLDPNTKIKLGADKEISIKEMIDHVEKEDSFGKKIVQIQIKTLQVLSRV